MSLVELHQPVALVAPESSLLDADGKQQPGKQLIFPFVRTKSDVRAALNNAAEQFGERFIQGQSRTIFVSQASWDVLDMAQREAAARADEANDTVE